AGLTIVHAPCPEVAAQFDQLARHRPPPHEPEPDWPPADFRNRQGAYAAYRGPRDQPPGIPRIEPLGMSPAIEVEDDDFVVATGQQLHDLCRERRILHLVFAGFATNWCVLGRDYGMRAMRRRGYNLILLRDATMGVEFPDTLGELTATELAVREAEQQIGFSASNEDFLAVCRGAGLA
ncbi:MAG: isochorismatase family protein, partial [Gemmatimonadetes bacterium]|nr:isochorismatase family protein [Gemmatimonadota bacterium]